MKPLPLPRRRIILAIAVLALGLLGGVGGSLALSWTRADEAEAVADEAEAQRDEAVAAIEDLCTQVEQLGRTCVEDPSDFQGAEGPAGPPGPPGPGLTESQIEAAFAAYFDEHPYEYEPSAAELTSAFATVLAEHPDLLYDQLYTAMADYLAANPPEPGPTGPAGADGQDGADGRDGADGAQGEPGRAPTAEEIRAQIESYVAEHGLPLCPEGSSPGPLTPLTTDGPIEIVGCIVESTEG